MHDLSRLVLFLLFDFVLAHYQGIKFFSSSSSSSSSSGPVFRRDLVVWGY